MINRGKRWIHEMLAKDQHNQKNNRNILHHTGAWLKSHTKTCLIGIVGVTVIVAASATVSITHQQYIETNTNEVYQVYIGDQKAGTISSPDVVDRYLQDKQQKLDAANENVHMVLRYDPLTYKSVKGFKLESNDQEVLSKLDGTVYAKAAGVELYINDRLIGVVKDQETADHILAKIESKYLPKETREVSILSSDSDEELSGKLESIEFVEDIDLQEVDTDPDKIMDSEEIVEILQSSESEPRIYTVESGDCLNCIAQKFDVSLDFIYERNKWIKNDFLQIGDKIDLTVEEPMLSVKTIEQAEDVEDIPFVTQYENDNTLRVGLTRQKQPGVKGKKRLTMKLTKVNGNLMDQEVVGEEVLEDPIPRIVLKGTKIIRGIGTGTFRWPVTRPKITSSYGPRWGTTHKGMDMTGNSSILAADNGKVVTASYNSGYGYYVIIDHQNGYRSLYGHLSKITTTKGALLEKGDKIGVMGSTGHSTGVHLHFEIHKNGRVQNPSHYLK